MKKKETKINIGVTNTARGIIYLMGFAVVAVCAILLPELAHEERVSNPNAGPAYPFLIGAWVLAVPIFIALKESLEIIRYIEKNTAFSVLTIKAIQNIKNCATLFSVLIALAATITIIIGRSVDPSEDFAPIASIGFMFTFAGSIIATFAAVLEKILKEALDLKEENDSII